MVRTLRVELGTKHGTMHRVASQLGYGTESVRAWVRQADIDEEQAPGVSTAEARRMRELEQKNRELCRANEILKRAASFFQGGARPPRQEVVAFIDANRHDIVEGRPLGVELICALLQVAPSTYYAAKNRAPSVRAVSDAVLTPELVALWRTTTASTVSVSSGKPPAVPR